jgi:hypothetical protein
LLQLKSGKLVPAPKSSNSPASQQSPFRQVLVLFVCRPANEPAAAGRDAGLRALSQSSSNLISWEQFYGPGFKPVKGLEMLYTDRIVAAFDGLALNVAILDQNGDITYVNPAWRRFAVDNDCPDPMAYLGLNYLDVCQKSSASGDTLAQAAHAGLVKILSGKVQDFRFVYPCHGPNAKRWFMMTVSKCYYSSDVVIAHDDVSLFFRA